MSPLEAILVWITIGLYGVTSALFLYAFIFRNEKVLDRIKYIIFFSVAVHTAAILARWYAVGNLPVAGNYENALGGVWVILLFYLYVSFRYKHLRAFLSGISI
jgi:ABC-type transport system involved in cytochrome c biogenesis permease subunit